MNNSPHIIMRYLFRHRSFVSCTICLLSVCVAPLLVVAQSSLPVKDYSVGNTFVYRSFNGNTSVDQIVEETVTKDTAIGNARYGIVETHFSASGAVERYLMRSNDTAVYQYIPEQQQEKMLYRFGQRCSASILPWLQTESICSVTVSSDSMAANYFVYNSFGSVTNSDGSTVSAFEKKNVYYIKPFGVANDFIVKCGYIYFPIHNQSWLPQCFTSSVELRRSVVRGVTSTLFT